MLRRSILLLALACATAPTLAFAQAQTESDGSEADEAASEEDARELFSQGARAFDEGRYAAALGFFEDAYRISDRHLLLYNIGQAQDRLRRDEEALATFRRYLELVEDPPYRLQVESRIRNLEESVERQRREHQALEEAQRRQDELQRREGSTGTGASASGLDATGPNDGMVDDDDSGILSKWWFWTIIGVVVVGGVAIGVGAAASGGTEEPIPGDVGGVVRTLRF